MLMVLSPAAALADSNSSGSNCTPPNYSGQPGVHQPVGSSAPTYTYDCSTGLWVNNYYTYDPNTDTYTPTYPVVYTYDDNTGLWDTTVWDYDTATGQYVQDSESVAQVPEGAKTVGGPSAPTTKTSTPSSGDPSSNNSNTTNPGSGDNQNTGNQGTDPSNVNTGGTSLNGKSDSKLNDSTTSNTAMDNTVSSQAGTGNVLADSNTNVGNAGSGNAQDIANVINMLQSSSNVLGNPNVLTFTDNINGNVDGNLLLDPNQLGTIQSANPSDNLNNNVTINNSANANINNDVNLGATSGNSTVSNNTNAGNATTGSATAVANIVNVLDSAITAGQSFIGVININGNLNGNIYLPPDFVNQLLASNVPYTTISSAQVNNTLSDTNNNSEAINNALDTSATSGSATVSNNTVAGNATSGAANTNVTVFNLTGSDIIGSNDLLVFVNVQGEWVGMILNAPAGTTAAELGGGITNNSITNNTTVNNTNNQAINNNIDLVSKSGNGTVSGNTIAGNATSGNAFSNVNLMNMINDSLSLNGWFGLLFINVFGTWNGSLAVEPLATTPAQTSANTSYAAAASSSPVKKVFEFTPSENTTASIPTYSASPQSNTTATPSNAVLADQVIRAGSMKPLTAKLATNKSNGNYWLSLVGVVLATIIILISERSHLFRSSKSN